MSRARRRGSRRRRVTATLGSGDKRTTSRPMYQQVEAGMLASGIGHHQSIGGFNAKRQAASREAFRGARRLALAELDEALEAGVLIYRDELKYDPDDVKISLLYQLYHSGRAVLHPGYDGADVDLTSPWGNARDLGGDWGLACPGESDIGSELDFDVELDRRARTPSEGNVGKYGGLLPLWSPLWKRRESWLAKRPSARAEICR
ncbi:uncharacterized protein DNG_00252 [Cephalotrichum gorgonifer]|uniref:Uncharacterized protein n=1 Tax=Cephalotrichum gorgonifer TaxID=2041049 RepID=A0AAE8MNW8_9PEZI|nr:uncharacterized protein DNG_00252 [Cephalotrichum gorgonifer]